VVGNGAFEVSERSPVPLIFSGLRVIHSDVRHICSTVFGGQNKRYCLVMWSVLVIECHVRQSKRFLSDRVKEDAAMFIARPTNSRDLNVACSQIAVHGVDQHTSERGNIVLLEPCNQIIYLHLVFTTCGVNKKHPVCTILLIRYVEFPAYHDVQK